MVCASGHTVHDPTTPLIKSFLILSTISLGEDPEVMPSQVKKMIVKIGAQNTWSITT